MLTGLAFVAGWIVAHFAVRAAPPTRLAEPARSRELTPRERTVIVWLGGAALLAILAPTCVQRVRLRLVDTVGETGGIVILMAALGILVGLAHGLMIDLPSPVDPPAVRRDRDRATLLGLLTAVGAGGAHWWWHGGRQPETVLVALAAGGATYFVLRALQMSMRQESALQHLRSSFRRRDPGRHGSHEAGPP